MITCGSIQSSALSCLFLNAIVLLKTRVFVYPTHLPHTPHDWQLCLRIYHRDERNTLYQLTLRNLFYSDNNTRYIAEHTLSQLVLQVQISLNRAGESSTRIPLTRHPHSPALHGAMTTKSLIHTKSKHTYNHLTNTNLQMTYASPYRPPPATMNMIHLQPRHCHPN